MVLGGGVQGFCDDSTKAFVIKGVKMGEGGQKNNLRDDIYGRPLNLFMKAKTSNST